MPPASDVAPSELHRHEERMKLLDHCDPPRYQNRFPPPMTAYHGYCLVMEQDRETGQALSSEEISSDRTRPGAQAHQGHAQPSIATLSCSINLAIGSILRSSKQNTTRRGVTIEHYGPGQTNGVADTLTGTASCSTPLVVSVMLTLVYPTSASVRVWPPGQVKSPGSGGSMTRQAVMLPFLPDANVPLAVTGPNTVILFAALGHWPPWLTQTLVEVTSCSD